MPVSLQTGRCESSCSHSLQGSTAGTHELIPVPKGDHGRRMSFAVLRSSLFTYREHERELLLTQKSHPPQRSCPPCPPTPRLVQHFGHRLSKRHHLVPRCTRHASELEPQSRLQVIEAAGLCMYAPRCLGKDSVHSARRLRKWHSGNFRGPLPQHGYISPMGWG